MNFYKGFIYFLGLFSLMNRILPVYATPEKDFIQFFDSDSILEIAIVFQFDSLYNSGNSEMKKHSATLILGNAWQGDTIPVLISKRGHFRKAFNICDFPPIRLHFSEDHTKNTIFEGLDKLKLVTHCQNADTLFDQYILQEYLLYKCYNLLTERSFKVRLARINYMDENHRYKNMHRWAFFIENPSDLAYRINGEVLNVRYITPQATDQYYYALMALFQYMIINQDWSVTISHNIEFIGIYPGLKPVTVPFDFDMAEMIHVPYRSPLLSYRTEKKQERKFPSGKINRKSMDRAIDKMKKQREKIRSLYTNNGYLADSLKNKSLKHIDDFFTILDNKASLRKQIRHKTKN